MSITENDIKQSLEQEIEIETKAETNNEQFLTFTLGKEEFGINIMLVSEIKAWSIPTRLPNVPNYLRGVVNLRGVIVPIVALRKRFGMAVLENSEKSVIIFLHLDRRTVGIEVDFVSDIINVDKSKIKSAPKIEGEIKDEFVNGLVNSDGHMLVLLNAEKLFEDSAKSDMTVAV